MRQSVKDIIAEVYNQAFWASEEILDVISWLNSLDYDEDTEATKKYLFEIRSRIIAIQFLLDNKS